MVDSPEQPAKPRIARLTTAMAADIRYPQVSRLPAGYSPHVDDLINRFEHWSRHPAQDFPAGGHGALTCTRTLQRRMEAVLKSPLAFSAIADERAKQLLLAEGKILRRLPLTWVIRKCQRCLRCCVVRLVKEHGRCVML